MRRSHLLHPLACSYWAAVILVGRRRSPRETMSSRPSRRQRPGFMTSPRLNGGRLRRVLRVHRRSRAWRDGPALRQRRAGDRRHPRSGCPGGADVRADAGGGERLVGVEWVVFVSAWAAAGNTSPPVLFGRTLNLVPEGNRYGIPAFYELHGWVWKPNPRAASTATGTPTCRVAVRATDAGLTTRVDAAQERRPIVVSGGVRRLPSAATRTGRRVRRHRTIARPALGRRSRSRRRVHRPTCATTPDTDSQIPCRDDARDQRHGRSRRSRSTIQHEAGRARRRHQRRCAAAHARSANFRALDRAAAPTSPMVFQHSADQPAARVRSQTDVGRRHGSCRTRGQRRTSPCSRPHARAARTSSWMASVRRVRRRLRRVAPAEGTMSGPVEREGDPHAGHPGQGSDTALDPHSRPYDEAARCASSARVQPRRSRVARSSSPRRASSSAVATVEVNCALGSSDAGHDRAMFIHGPSRTISWRRLSWRRAGSACSVAAMITACACGPPSGASAQQARSLSLADIPGMNTRCASLLPRALGHVAARTPSGRRALAGLTRSRRAGRGA